MRQAPVLDVSEAGATSHRKERARMNVRPVVIGIVCITILLTGCHTMRPVDLNTSKPLATLVAPKDFVRVWMRDGRVIEMQVSEVEADALVGKEQRLPFKDIERLERRGISATRTTLLIVGIGAAVVLGIGIYASHHVMGFPSH